MGFASMQNEIVDNLALKQFELSVGATPITISPPSNRVIRYFYLQVPDIGPNSNNMNRYLRFSIDDGTTFTTIKRGEAIMIEGKIDTNEIIVSGDGGAGTVKFEIVLGLDVNESV